MFPLTLRPVSLRRAGWGHNAAMKSAIALLLYGEPLKWDSNLKVYTLKVTTKQQARALLSKLRELEGHAEDLPAAVDENILANLRVPTINLIPVLTPATTAQPHQVIVADGNTFQVRAQLKEFGFQYTFNFRGEAGVNVWLIDRSDFTDEIKKTMTVELEKMGFEVVIYDGIA